MGAKFLLERPLGARGCHMRQVLPTDNQKDYPAPRVQVRRRARSLERSRSDHAPFSKTRIPEQITEAANVPFGNEPPRRGTICRETGRCGSDALVCRAKKGAFPGAIRERFESDSRAIRVAVQRFASVLCAEALDDRAIQAVPLTPLYN